MYYLAYISHDYQTKNKLEKSILAYLRTIERELDHSAEIEMSKAAILNFIAQLNHAHPRCKPIKASFRASQDKQDFTLEIDGICHFQLLKTK